MEILLQAESILCGSPRLLGPLLTALEAGAQDPGAGDGPFPAVAPPVRWALPRQTGFLRGHLMGALTPLWGPNLRMSPNLPSNDTHSQHRHTGVRAATHEF